MESTDRNSTSFCLDEDSPSSHAENLDTNNASVDESATIGRLSDLDSLLEHTFSMSGNADSEFAFSRSEIHKHSNLLMWQLLADGDQETPSMDSSPTGAAPALGLSFIPHGMVLNGQYEVRNLISSGGCGKVYKGFHKGFQKPIAIKVLRGNLAARPDLRKRFEKEAGIMASIHHPNVIRIYDVQKFGNHPYLVMDFVDGVNLEEFVAGQRPLTPKQLLDLITKLAEALSVVHLQNIIHRDIKPANIMIAGANEPILMDFGISKETIMENCTRDGLTADNVSLGTPEFMAPEQFSEPGNITSAADIYALGLTFYFLISGTRVSVGGYSKCYRQLKRNELRFRLGNDRVPDGLCKIICKMIDRKPENRFQNGAELEQALKDVRGSKTRIYVQAILITCLAGALGGVISFAVSSNKNSSSKPDHPQAALAGPKLDSSSVVGSPVVVAGSATDEAVDWYSKPRIFSVIPFDANENENSYFSGQITKILFDNGYELVERKRIDLIINQLEISQTQLVSAATTLRIGKLTGSHIIITGDIAHYEGNKQVNVRAFDVETSDILGMAAIEPDGLTQAVETLLREIRDNLVYRSLVESVDAESLRLKHGRRYGAAIGMQLRVLNEEDDTIGLVEVSEVGKITTAKMISNTKEIATGMRVEEVK